jgi:hypothetical protein
MSDEKSSDRDWNCNCKCHNNDIVKTGNTTHILGSATNSVDLYCTTPPETKWSFVDDMEKEVKTNFPDGWDYVGRDTDEQC